jgi:peptide/nickel transport system permease protein
MLVFVVRRVVGMVLVLVAVSFIVFLIFVVVPGGDPAQRIAGRTATEQNIENIRHDWGFDRPFYVQYYDLMKKAFTNELVSQTNQTSVDTQIWEGIPATFSLAVGAAVIWLLFGVLVGVFSAITAGRLSDRLIT